MSGQFVGMNAILAVSVGAAAAAAGCERIQSAPSGTPPHTGSSLTEIQIPCNGDIVGDRIFEERGFEFLTGGSPMTFLDKSALPINLKEIGKCSQGLETRTLLEATLPADLGTVWFASSGLSDEGMCALVFSDNQIGVACAVPVDGDPFSPAPDMPPRELGPNTSSDLAI